jgi:hypothetical protein
MGKNESGPDVAFANHRAALLMLLFSCYFCAFSALPSCWKLKREFGRQLNPSWPAAAQKGVPYANIPGCHDLISAVANLAAIHGIRGESAAACRIKIRRRIGDECRKQGVGKVRVIEDVKKIGAKLKAQTLSDGRVLVNGQIPLLERWTD